MLGTTRIWNSVQINLTDYNFPGEHRLHSRSGLLYGKQSSGWRPKKALRQSNAGTGSWKQGCVQGGDEARGIWEEYPLYLPHDLSKTDSFVDERN